MNHYGSRKAHVKMAVDYIRDIIDEKIGLLSSSIEGGDIVWLRKETRGEAR